MHDIRKSQKLAKLHEEFVIKKAIAELEVSLEHVLERLHALEEKDRQRAREEHERDVS